MPIISIIPTLTYSRAQACIALHAIRHRLNDAEQTEANWQVIETYEAETGDRI